MELETSAGRAGKYVGLPLRWRVFPLLAAGTPLFAQVVITFVTGKHGAERDLGQLAIATSVGSVISLVGDLGTGSGLVRLGASTIATDRAGYVWSTRLVTALGALTFTLFAFVATALFDFRLGSVSETQLLLSIAAGSLLLMTGQELLISSVLAGPDAWARLVILRAFVGGGVYVIAYFAFALSPYVSYLVSAVVLAALVIPSAAAILRVGRPVIRFPVAFRLIGDGARLTLGTIAGAGSVMGAPLLIVAFTDIELVGSLRALMLVSGGVGALVANYLGGVYFPSLTSTADPSAQNEKFLSTFRLVVAASGMLVLVPFSGLILKRLGLSVLVGQRHAWALIIVSDTIRMATAVLAYFVLVRSGIRAFVIREVTNGLIFLTLVALAAGEKRLSLIAGAYALGAIMNFGLYLMTAWPLLHTVGRHKMMKLVALFLLLAGSNLLIADYPAVLLLAGMLVVSLLGSDVVLTQKGATGRSDRP